MTKLISHESEAKRLTKLVQEKVIQKHRNLFLDPDNKFLEQQEQVIRQEVRNLLDRDDPEIEDYIMDQLIGYQDLALFINGRALSKEYRSSQNILSSKWSGRI